MTKKSTAPRKNPHAVAMVKRRMVVLSDAQRSGIAAKAAKVRWDRVRAAKAAAKPKRKGARGKAAA